MEKQKRHFPSIWLTFERVIDGTVRKFWVQDLTDDHLEKALELFRKYFLRDEPFSRSLRLLEDEKSIQFGMKFWKGVAEKKCSLACFTKLENGQEELVALNFCYKSSVHEQHKENDGESELVGRLIEATNFIYGLKDPLKELGVEEYLAAIGLVVVPEYRGLNIGLEVLRARQPLCAKLGLHASLTVFTSEAAQRLAEKAGFKDLVALTYDELERMNNSFKFPNINDYSRKVRYMYILYQ